LLDIPLAVILICVLAIPLSAAVFIVRILRGRKKSFLPRIIYISSSGNVRQSVEKFGGLDFLVNYEGPAVNTFFDKIILYWFPGEKNRKIFPSGNFEVNECKYLKYIPLISGLFCFIKILVSTLREKISLIRSYDPFIAGVMGYAVSKLTGIPFCVSIHSDYDKRYQLNKGLSGATLFGSHRLANLAARLVLSNADAVLPIRESLSDYAIHHGARPDKIRVIPHGIDLSYFEKPPIENFKKSYNISPEKKLVLFAGRLSRENYVYDVVEIARLVLTKRNDIIFVLLGGGVEEKGLNEKIKDFGLSDKFLLLGFQPHNTVLEFRKQADVNLVLMGGYSLIEACASGKPVISYDVEWHYELIKDGVSGFLIKEGNWQAVADRIELILSSEQTALNLGRSARKMAFEKHSSHNASLHKVKVYEWMLKTAQQNK